MSKFAQWFRPLSWAKRTPVHKPRRRERVRPAIEALEDRLALSFAFQSGSALIVVASPGAANHARPILLEADPNDHSKLDVFDTGTLLGRFSKASITAAAVEVQGNDAIFVDDSNDDPFVSANVKLNGSGANNSFELRGSRAVGGEFFRPGTATQDGELAAGFAFFHFTSAIPFVSDEVPDGGVVSVEALGQGVDIQSGILAGETVHTGTFGGLSPNASGGGTTFSFANKANIALQLLSPNATFNDDLVLTAQGLKEFQIIAEGQNDTVNINATPSGVTTDVVVESQPDEQVNLHANSGPVNIHGNGTDVAVRLGSFDADFSKSVTSRINANVTVSNAGSFVIADGGNVKTSEKVKVTESTVSGTGLFGNNGVVVQYSSATLSIITGRLANAYTVTGSHPGARLFSIITIDGTLSSAGLSVQADVDSGSHMDLHLLNPSPVTGHLVISAPGEQFNPQKPVTPNGTEFVAFTGLLPGSLVQYQGFNTVTLSS
jgi:hypothetical protein